MNAALFRKIIDKYVPGSHDVYEILSSASSRIDTAMKENEEKKAAKDAAAMELDSGTTADDDDDDNEMNFNTEDSMMDVESVASGLSTGFIPTTLLPELEVFMLNLATTTLLRENCIVEALGLSKYTIERVNTFNRRSLDSLASKSYFYFSLIHEKLQDSGLVVDFPNTATAAISNGVTNGGSASILVTLKSIRTQLLKAYRTACVRRDESGQAMILNLLLRNYLKDNLIDAADSLSTKAVFPSNASNNQLCRFLYYMGRIRAIQLQYGEAHHKLLQASRKAPTNGALGFITEVTKLSILVQLLMGELPNPLTSGMIRKGMFTPLKAYLELAKAVKKGDLSIYEKVAHKYHDVFKTDNNLSFVERLQHNVLKTGLKKISISYSRVSLNDVASKLCIGSAKSAEYVCSKAIRDGVIDATIDHDHGWLKSSEGANVYYSEEPQKAFHRRIAFCLDTHNEAVKSMRYPPDAYKKKKDREKKNQGSDKTDDDVEKTIDELIEEMEGDDSL